MPELPEVETVVQGLLAQVKGSEIFGIKVYYDSIVIGSANGFKKELKGAKLKNIWRHGKYIFITLNREKTVVNHLRMTGQLFVTDLDREKDKHTHLEILLKDKKIVYRDVRKFGRFELIKNTDIDSYMEKRRLAPDALVITEAQFLLGLGKKKKNLKGALLDQTVIAGLGNIYVDEVLHCEKLSPLIVASSLSHLQGRNLLKCIKKTLKRAILKKGTTFSDYITSYGDKGKFQLSLKAYKRKGEPCQYCATPLAKTEVAGRGTYFCPKCQN